MLFRSGRKPTKEMLKQEAKIKSQMAKGGITGDYFSMADKEQFKQLMSLLNELIEKKFATDCFIEDKDNSVVFLTGKNVSDSKKNQIFNFVNETLKQKYDAFINNLNWIYADGELQGFKVYFKKHIVYAKSGKTNNINCIDFINQSDALQNNGYLYYFKNILVYCESGQSIPNVKSFCLITYNSGGQKNLKITDTKIGRAHV